MADRTRAASVSGATRDRPARRGGGHEPVTAGGPAARRWPVLHRDVLALVFVGGCVGGYGRYAITRAWTSTRDGFPWATFTVNTVGAFVLAAVIVIATDLRANRYLRPLIGTGFCGALTTFSSVVVSTDELLAHHHAGTAAAYLSATTAAGLAAAAAGAVLTRALGAWLGRRDRPTL